MDRRGCLSGRTRHLCDESVRVELATGKTFSPRSNTRLAASSCGYVCASSLETTRMQLQETVKGITEGPIVQSPEAWPPLSIASPHYLESSAGPSGRARIHLCRTPRELCILPGPGCPRGSRRKPLREASRFPVGPRFQSSDHQESCCPAADLQVPRTSRCRHPGGSREK